MPRPYWRVTLAATALASLYVQTAAAEDAPGYAPAPLTSARRLQPQVLQSPAAAGSPASYGASLPENTSRGEEPALRRQPAPPPGANQRRAHGSEASVVVSPWTRQLGPVYPSYGGTTSLYTNRLPDYSDQAPVYGSGRFAHDRPVGLETGALANPQASGFRNPPTFLPPAGFIAPYYTGINDPLRSQYGPGIRPVIPMYGVDLSR